MSEVIEEKRSGERRLSVKDVLGWRGLMDDTSVKVRVIASTALALGVIALVFTQLGFVAIDGVRFISVLIPLCVGALVYGVLTATLLGLLVGVVTMVHATVLPLDYYEMFFMAPANSVVLFTLTGFIAGVAFALVCLLGRGSRAKMIVLLIPASLVCSWFCSTFFQVFTWVINTLSETAIPEDLLNAVSGHSGILVQILVDALGVFLFTVLTLFLDAKRRARAAREPSLRETFQAWLFVVFVLAFLTTAAISYVLVTFVCLGRANTALDGHLDYISNQLIERDAIMSDLMASGALDSSASADVIDTSIKSIASGLRLWESGMTIVAEDGVVITASNDAFVGMNFADVINAGAHTGYSEEIFNTKAPIEFYLGEGLEVGYFKATQISYMRVERVGQYQIAAILPGSEVFFYRSAAMVSMSILFLLLFGIVFALSMRLLDRVVVSGIDRTNEALGLITEGDLERQVDVHDSREFSSLSLGINTTVGALKESIAEASARLDRELATAKAIQESALPRIFPPYPEIDRFDIFANMKPAKEVGGDFYDLFLIDDDHLGIVMADVSGKGIPAALFMMSAKTEIQACMKAQMGLAEALQTANYHLCRANDAGMFVTVFAGVLDFSMGHLQYVNAGHNPPALRHDGSWTLLSDKSGLFLGAYEKLRLKLHETTIVEGDELFLYTDGVTEAMDPDEAFYGEEGLLAFLNEHVNLHPRRLIEAVSRDLTRFANGAEQADDITMLCVEYGVAPELGASILLPAKLAQLDRAMAFVHGELTRRMCPLSVQNKLDICLEELFVNVASYAYPEETMDGKPGKVRVSYVYHTQPAGITIEVSDEGVPFDPLAKPDPDRPTSIDDVRIGGMGIMMTKRIADDIRYEHRDGCNVTSFTKIWGQK